MQVWGRWRAPKARVTPEVQAWSSRSQAELLGGRLPLSSQERLAEGHAPFTSDLTTAQLASLRSGGWEPVGQVFGSAVVTRSARYFRHPAVYPAGRYPGRSPSTSTYAGHTVPSTWSSGEVYGWYDADREARRTALRRMRLEMDRLGADGAVGLRLSDKHFPGVPIAEYTMVATAIRSVVPLPATPFITEMSAADLVALRRTGYVPCAPLFMIGRYLTCSWNVGLTRGPGSLSTFATAPRELVGPTEVSNNARRHARGALASQLSTIPGASMVLHDLDVRLTARECNAGNEDLLADVVATGTAIVPATARSAPPSPGRLTVHPVVSLAAPPAPAGGTP